MLATLTRAAATLAHLVERAFNRLALLSPSRAPEQAQPHTRVCDKHNDGQGLGFNLAGIVIDKKSMVAYGAKLYGALATVVHAVLNAG
jgi:hypothetical protein